MTKYNVVFYYSINYFGQTLFFEKQFQLNFIPFQGLRFTDGNDDEGIELELKEYNGNFRTDYLDICYETKNDIFTVSLRIHWKTAPSIEHIKSTIEGFTRLGWQMPNKATIDAFVELVKENQK